MPFRLTLPGVAAVRRRTLATGLWFQRPASSLAPAPVDSAPVPSPSSRAGGRGKPRAHCVCPSRPPSPHHPRCARCALTRAWIVPCGRRHKCAAERVCVARVACPCRRHLKNFSHSSRSSSLLRRRRATSTPRSSS